MKGRNRFLLLIAMLAAALCLVFGACGGGKIVLSFETNGAPEIAAQEYDAGSTFTLPEPQWEGHSFEGWYEKSDFSGSPVLSGTAEKSTTFYAKWEQMPEIRLNLGGGALAAGEKLYLKAGEDLFSFMQNYRPTKANSEFGAWLLGDAELTAGAKMPAEGVTLKARYKTAYTVEVYLQTLAQDGYEKGDDIVGYEYAGTSLTPKPEVHGFTLTENSNAVTTKTIGDDPSANVFRLYYDRLTYNVYFLPAYPDGSSGDSVSESHLFGEEITLPFDTFAVEGYLLSGWAETPAGDPLYRYDYAADCYNSDAEAAPVTHTVDGETFFYAVWKQGYTDMFGGSDVIYLFDETSGEIFLSRAGMFFVGAYRATDNTFYFDRSDDVEPLEGRLFGDGTFAFYSDIRSSRAFFLFEVGSGVNRDTQILFDEYNGLIYSVTVNDETVQGTRTEDSKGTYTIDEYGYYVAVFNSGKMSGQTITFITGEAREPASNSTVPAFQVRNEEEYGWGVLYRAAIAQGQLTYYTTAYRLVLDGFSTATLVTASNTLSNYTYRRDGELINLYNASSGAAYQSYRLLPELVNGRRVYGVYNASYEHTYTDDNGNELTLDGFLSATCTGTDSFEGYYTVSSSVFGNLVTVVTGGKTRLFLTSTATTTVTDEEGGSHSETTYRFTEKPLDYQEYYYSDETGVPNGPLVVFSDSFGAAGKVTVYGYVPATRDYEKTLLGSVQEEDGSYLFTTEEVYKYSEEVSTSIWDYSKITAFTFGLDVYVANTLFGSMSLPVFYVSATTFKDGEVETESNLAIYYSEKEGSAELALVGSFAFLTVGEETTVGQFSVNGVRMTITPYNGSASVYLEIDEEGKTFVRLTNLLGTTYGFDLETGSRVSSETLVFDGKGGAVLTTEDEDGEQTTLEGTVRATDDTTEAGARIYEFTGGGETFRFILANTSSYTLFAREYEQYAGMFSNEDGERLVLDGFGVSATYYNAVGESIPGTYIVPEENVVILIFAVQNTQYVIYFDLSGQEFTVRGGEYGTYVVFDNNGMNGLYLDLDGYNKASVYRMEEDEEAEDGVRSVPIDENAAYERTESGYIVSYQDGANHYELRGQRGTVTIAGVTIRAFFLEHLEVVATYVNPKDWSALVVNAYGMAEKHMADGTVENGMVSLITEDLLYYVNNAGTDACIYRYNQKTATVTEIRYEARGYYTEDLDALLFSNAGFMIAGGETRFYYNVEADNTVTLYRQAADDPKANKYGFIEEKFGAFQDTVEFEGKTYHANSGFAIVFKRDASETEKFPVRVGTDEEKNPIMGNFEQLTFAPTGSRTFTVRGSVVVAGSAYDCYVTREADEEGNTRLYVTLGSFVFDVNVNYQGSAFGAQNNNSFKVTALRAESGYYASSYLLNYYFIYTLFHQAIGNSFGYITFVTEFDEQGQETVHYLNGRFGESSGMFDSLGELVSFDHATYTEGEQYYSVDVEGTDKEHYRMNFRLTGSYYQLFGVYSYDLIGFTHVETLTDAESGYTVEVEQIVASDNYQAGSYFTLKLFKPTEGEEKTQLEATSIFVNEDTFYFIIREENEDKIITSSTYYIIELGAAEELPEGTTMPRHDSVKVSEKTAQVVYNAEKDAYVEIVEEKVMLLHLNGNSYLIENSVYADGVYTITTFGGMKYTVTVADGVATITEVVEPEE